MKINVIYFSCGRDEESLKLSIDSLVKFVNPNKIIVVSDQRDPIVNPDPSWIIENQESSDKLLGLDNIRRMVSIFAKYSENCDYIMKIDSDIIVSNGEAFQKLAENRYDAYGGHPMASEEMIPTRHFTGAAYFISSDWAKALECSLEAQGWDNAVHRWKFIDYPEDMCISHMLNKVGAKVQVDWSAMNRDGFYWFDMFLRGDISQDRENVKKYSFVHCRSNDILVRLLYEMLYF